MNNAEIALDVLKGLLSGKYEVTVHSAGLCLNLGVLAKNKHDVYIELHEFLDWCDFNAFDKFTGDPSIPVPHPQDATGMIYFDLPTTCNYWNKRTAYGRNRWEFVQFCADTIERKIQEGKYD